MQTQIFGLILVINSLINSVELSVTLYFLHDGTVHSERVCGRWVVLNYSLFQTSIYLMAWTSIERYLYIYHERIIKQHTIVLHYAPIVTFSLYCPLFYTGVVMFHHCQPVYDLRLYMCGGACYALEPALGLFDWLFNGIFIDTVILCVDIVVITRHIIQRRRMKRVIITADARQRWVRYHFHITICAKRIQLYDYSANPSE